MHIRTKGISVTNALVVKLFKGLIDSIDDTTITLDKKSFSIESQNGSARVNFVVNYNTMDIVESFRGNHTYKTHKLPLEYGTIHNINKHLIPKIVDKLRKVDARTAKIFRKRHSWRDG